jgi:DNA-binding FadR family transcriptional regulator
MTRRPAPADDDAVSARLTGEPAADLSRDTEVPEHGNGSLFTLEQPSNRKLAAGIADDIEQYIIRRGWPVGEVIFSEADLMERYNASRSIVREAARLLEQHTTARMRKGRGGGLVVTRPDVEPVTNVVAVCLEYEGVTPLQLFEARVALELSAVELATERVTEDDIERLRHAIEAERNIPLDELWRHTHDIHVAIAEVAKSPAFPLFVTVLTKLVDARATSHASGTRAPEIYHAHSAIVEAIIAGDASLARHRMRRHLEAITPYLH